MENRPTPGVSVCPLHIEGRRLDAVRRVLQEMGLDRFDLIRLDAATYAVREPVIGAGRRARPRTRRTVRSLVRVTAWDGHRPAGIEFEDTLETV